MFKVGLELFVASGPPIVAAMAEIGLPVFLDLKFHDIPHTVSQVVRVATRMGVSMMNIHASGGSQMIHAACEAAQDESAKIGANTPIILAVTVLTSIDQNALRDDLLVDGTVENVVAHHAKMAMVKGAGGVIASPKEIEVIRKACGDDFKIVTPGVRPAGADVADQKRVATPEDAIRRGSDYVVIGRPILTASDPVRAANEIAHAIDHG